MRHGRSFWVRGGTTVFDGSYLHRGDSRCTFVNQISGLRLALSIFPQRLDFKGNAILDRVTPGLYSKRK